MTPTKAMTLRLDKPRANALEALSLLLDTSQNDLMLSAFDRYLMHQSFEVHGKDFPDRLDAVVRALDMTTPFKREVVYEEKKVAMPWTEEDKPA